MLSRKEFLFFYLACFAALLPIGSTKLLQDPDALWHIVVGRQIWDSGELIFSDSFSFTCADQPWIANQWLAEILLASVAWLAGFDGLVLLAVTVLAGLFATLACRLMNCGLHWLVASFFVAVVFAASAYNLHVRPHLWTIVFQAVLVAALCRLERRPETRGQLWFLLPLFVLWTNLHGGVLAGLGTLGVAMGGWLIWGLAGRPSPIAHWHQLVWYGGLFVALMASTLVNPYGFAMHRAWLAILTADLPNLVIEHAPADLGRPEGQIIVGLALLYVCVLWSVPLAKTRVTWVLPLVWFVLALMRIRNGPLFAVTTAIVLADILPQSKLAQWLRRRNLFFPPDERSLPRPVSGWHATAVKVFTLALFSVATVYHWSGPGVSAAQRDLRLGWARPPATVFPMQLLPALKQAERANPVGTGIFNEQHLGGFLIYNMPGFRVFVDGRFELYGDEFLHKYMRARDDSQVLRDWESEYQFRYALTQTGSRIDRYFAHSDRWRVVAQAPTATFYERSEDTRPNELRAAQ